MTGELSSPGMSTGQPAHSQHARHTDIKTVHINNINHHRTRQLAAVNASQNCCVMHRICTVTQGNDPLPDVHFNIFSEGEREHKPYKS